MSNQLDHLEQLASGDEDGQKEQGAQRKRASPEDVDREQRTER